MRNSSAASNGATERPVGGLVAVVLCATALGAVSATAGGRQQPEAVGVMFNCLNASAADRAAVFPRLAAAHLGWVRINVAWDQVEPARDSYSKPALAALDGCVAAARASGLRVLVVFLATPSWARSGGTITTPPDDPSDYARALGYLAARYRSEVSAWEVWNEENARCFWQGSAGQYVALLRDAYAAVKQSSPRSLVVFGGTAHNDPTWLRSCYAAGAKGSFDVLTTHPYPRRAFDTDVARVLGSTRSLRRVMERYGDAAKPIWFTEFGWSASVVGERRQARALTRSLDYIRDRLPYVTNAIWFEAKNELPTVARDSWQGGLSLISPELRPTPAYDALRAWIGGASTVARGP